MAKISKADYDDMEPLELSHTTGVKYRISVQIHFAPIVWQFP